MKVYLAGPFFNPKQAGVIAKIEDILGILGITYYSPRQEGRILIDMPLEERRRHTKVVFDRNIEKMTWADTIIAVVDDRDQGTMIELGYCIGIQDYDRANYKIVTYTEDGHGLNVMLQEAVDAHCKGTVELTRLLEHLSRGNEKIFEEYRNFNANVT